MPHGEASDQNREVRLGKLLVQLTKLAPRELEVTERLMAMYAKQSDCATEIERVIDERIRAAKLRDAIRTRSLLSVSVDLSLRPNRQVVAICQAGCPLVVASKKELQAAAHAVEIKEGLQRADLHAIRFEEMFPNSLLEARTAIEGKSMKSGDVRALIAYAPEYLKSGKTHCVYAFGTSVYVPGGERIPVLSREASGGGNVEIAFVSLTEKLATPSCEYLANF
jgi:hypothetical protein